MTQNKDSISAEACNAAFSKDLLGKSLKQVALAHRAHPELTKNQVIDLRRINNDRILVEATLQLVEETRRWRYNLVESGILDIEGKPLNF